MAIDIQRINKNVAGKAPQEVIREVIEADENIFITTNFGPYSSVALHMLTQVKPDIPVIWIDSGLNKPETYAFAEKTIDELGLNVKIYTPKITVARLEAVLGGIPDVNESRHSAFTEHFKLEPFRRAMSEQKNKIWFSAVRREQTKLRETMDYVAVGPYGLIKVAPLLDWTQSDMQDYIDAHKLPNETVYFDPTKAHEKRECGLHTLPVGKPDEQNDLAKPLFPTQVYRHSQCLSLNE